MSEELKNYCFEYAIERELTQAKTPQQNGVSERRNRTIIKRTWSIAADCNLPSFLWPEAVNMATHLINKSPTRSNFGVLPESSFTSKPFDLSNLKIFGCLAHVHVPRGDRGKMDRRSHMCTFVGYDMQSKAYRLYNHIRKEIIINRDVVFDESRAGLRLFATCKSQIFMTNLSLAVTHYYQSRTYQAMVPFQAVVPVQHQI